ncbi:branched-chain amino acid ABC transporter permease [Trebonia kvetii]|nr:branched-chain amino acid ABC transporter permease [Trebonia kvetii]
MMTLIWSGLASGAVYALVAIGYNIVFVSSQTFNFAQAQLVMVGAFVAYNASVTWHLPLWAVALIATAAVLALATVEERVAVRPVSEPDALLVTTLGVATLLSGGTQLIWGSQPLSVPFPGSSNVISVFGGRIYPYEVGLVAAPVVLVLIYLYLSRRLTVGLALLGMAEDREAAILRGVNVRLLALGTFALAGAVAGLVSLLVGPYTFAVATLGSELALKGFVVLAIGGFGSMGGSLVGAVIVGLVEAVASRYLGTQYSDLCVFAVLLIVLFARPAGLFVRTRERVV